MHAAHAALTAFKLCDRRTSYDTLRSLVVTTAETNIPSFDECGVGVANCDAQVCCSISDLMLKIPFSPPSCGGSSVAPTWSGGAARLGKTERVCQVEEEEEDNDDDDDEEEQQQQQHHHHHHHHHHRQQQQLPCGINAPSLVAWDAGLSLGGMETVRGTAARGGPRYDITGASELGALGEQRGGGGGWSERRGEETLDDNHASGAAIDGRNGLKGRGDGVGSVCTYLPHTSHPPHERSGQRAPCFSGDAGLGPFCKAAAVVQHHHDFSCAPDDHQQVVRRTSAAGAFVPKKLRYPRKLADYPRRCEAARDGMVSRNNSGRAAIRGSVVISDSVGGFIPFHDLQQGGEPLIDSKSEAQLHRYDGGQRRGGGGDSGDDGGAAEFSDLVGLLLDDELQSIYNNVP